ncbi:MAG: YggS family pyridoxal phosphate-dependent enzyme [Flavobacteriaceae bacterium]|jgi:pyridoxal phosphate enzyme (YggS family)
MSVSATIENFRKDIPQNVTLIAVSKTKPISLIQEAYATGQRDFGENKVQELVEKQEALPDDIRWHMIGHLQRNKVKYIAPFVHLIHGVDSLRLLKEINKQGAKINRCIPVLLQVHISQEDTKFGFDSNELKEAINECKVLEWIKPCGLMGMATFTSDLDQVRREFQGLKDLFDQYQSNFGENPTLSMGMSGDYKVAIDQGSTMIRIGSSLFGSR